MSVPVDVAAARSAATKKYERHWATWAADGCAIPALALPLHPPTERAALADQRGAVAWVRSWAGQPGVEWADRAWASVGRQSVPVRLVLATPGDVASLAGRAFHWRRAASRAAQLLSAGLALGEQQGGEESGRRGCASAMRDAVVRSMNAVVDLDEGDFERLTGVLAWLRDHPDSGLRIRQLPIRGVDTKWVGRHEPLVSRLHRAATGRDGLGLAPTPGLIRILIRMRFLDAGLAPGGLSDIAAPLADVASLAIAPRTVFVFENLESVLAMPACPDAVVVHGSGYAVDRIGRLPWVTATRIVYWGDLDSHGFAILNRLRAEGLTVATTLMDLCTLDAHSDLWVPEPVPATGTPTHLLSEELEVVAGLAERGNVRLEQERIPWPYALTALHEASRNP